MIWCKAHLTSFGPSTSTAISTFHIHLYLNIAMGYIRLSFLLLAISLSVFSPVSLVQSHLRATSSSGMWSSSARAVNVGLFLEPPASDFDKYFPTGWKHADLQQSITKLYQTEPSTDNPPQNGTRYLQSEYTVRKKWLVVNAGYAELKINASVAKMTEVFGHPAYNYHNAQRGGPVINYLQSEIMIAAERASELIGNLL